MPTDLYISVCFPSTNVSIRIYFTKNETPEFIRILLTSIKWGKTQSVTFIAREGGIENLGVFVEAWDRCASYKCAIGREEGGGEWFEWGGALDHHHKTGFYSNYRAI